MNTVGKISRKRISRYVPSPPPPPRRFADGAGAASGAAPLPVSAVVVVVISPTWISGPERAGPRATRTERVTRGRRSEFLSRLGSALAEGPVPELEGRVEGV